MLTGCCQQPVNITHDCTNCCLYRIDPPDDEQQACSKHVEAYYWNKLIENSASYWFLLYGYITMHGQQNMKFTYSVFVALVSQHEKHMRRAILSFVTSLALRYSATLSHERHGFRIKCIEHKCVCWFSLQILAERFSNLRRIERHTIINIRGLEL